MSKKKKIKNVKSAPVQTGVERKRLQKTSPSLFPWLLPILAITAICFLPMLSNELTNWDDEFYVVQNKLLRGPDWTGMFNINNPVVSNYHPITVLTLAINYQMTQLDPSSYLFTNLIFHLANTGLVFYFILLISGRKTWVAAFCAIIFGIHPMHVESVAWISERKDVLYTFFFLLSLIQYWYFLNSNKKKNIILSLLFFVLSILSKPAAIILPFILFLLDYWYGQNLKKNLSWKIPFFLISIVLAIITVSMQSKTAIGDLDHYPLWSRFFFATYTSTIYILRFFVPYPLSTFHPLPSSDNLGWALLLSPLFSLALLIFVWIKRKNKLIVFSFLFFMINLALVLQLIPVGGTLVSERYTYVPYITMAFLIGMLLDKYSNDANKKLLWGIPAAILFVFCIMTFFRTKVWKNSEVLWTDVLKHYPDAPVPRTNRASYYIQRSQQAKTKEEETQLLQKVLEDCTVALKAKPNHAKGYENRQYVYLQFNQDSLAMADANTLIRLQPKNHLAYYTKAAVYQRFNLPDSSIKYYDESLEINPNSDFTLNNRGSLLFNYYQKYKEALADFTKAIEINPQGDYYLNRSYCYYKLGEMALARQDAIMATQVAKKVTIPESYRQLLKI